jgi:hypothetical protein
VIVVDHRPLPAALTVSRLIGEARAGERDPDAFYRPAGQTYDDPVGYSDRHAVRSNRLRVHCQSWKGAVQWSVSSPAGRAPESSGISVRQVRKSVPLVRDRGKAKRIAAESIAATDDWSGATPTGRVAHTDISDLSEAAALVLRTPPLHSKASARREEL